MPASAARGGPPETTGAIPTKPRSTRRASPKFRPGSRCWTRVKMSPLAVAQRVPPAAAVMVDDDDLALAAAVFEAAAGALRTVEPPHRRQPLQQRGAAHLGLQPFNLCVLLAHRSILLSGSAGQGRLLRVFPFCSTLPSGTPATAKPARGKGVRSTGARSATHPCRAAGASGSAVVWFVLLSRARDRHPKGVRRCGAKMKGVFERTKLTGRASAHPAYRCRRRVG